MGSQPSHSSERIWGQKGQVMGHGRGKDLVLTGVERREYFPWGRTNVISLAGTRYPPRPVSPPQHTGNRLAPEQDTVNHWSKLLPHYSKFGLKTVCLLRQKIKEQKPFQRRAWAKIPFQFYLLGFDLLTNMDLPGVLTTDSVQSKDGCGMLSFCSTANL